MSRVNHFEIAAADPATLVAFYETAFGWTAEQWDGPVDYWLLRTGDQDEPGIDGAIMAREGPDPHQDIPVAGYLCTVGVDDVEAAAGRVIEAGGTVHGEPQDIPEVGRHVYATDPAGNQFGIIEPVEMD